jgi:hypothetical protein
MSAGPLTVRTKRPASSSYRRGGPSPNCVGLIIWEQKYGHGSRWGSTPRVTMLANASSKLLLACSRFRQYTYLTSEPELRKDEMSTGGLFSRVKRSGREAEIQWLFLSLQCLLRLCGLRAGHAGLDSRQGQDFFPLHNVQTGFAVNPASYQMSTGSSFSGGNNLCKL